jgi:hypothetical protein
MPNISVLKNSKFLSKGDVGKGLLLTIRGCEEMNVALASEPPEMKFCLSFDEHEKPMVLNSTKAQIIASICGSEETDDWAGHKIVVLTDPNVQFQGRVVGGLVVRAPRIAPAPKPPGPPKPAPPPPSPSPRPRPVPVPVTESAEDPPAEGDEVPF